MASPILKITKDPITLTIKKAKVVAGQQFGNQLWCVVQDDAGDEATLYLPWTNKEGNMSGVAQQFIKTGVMGPEDFVPDADAWIEVLHDHRFTFDRVFKNGNQYINVNLADSALRTAAVRELDLQAQQDDAEFAAALGNKGTAAAGAPRPQAMPSIAARKPRETADARIDRAYQHVMERYAPALAELDPQLARAIVALTATFAIAYEKE